MFYLDNVNEIYVFLNYKSFRRFHAGIHPGFAIENEGYFKSAGSARKGV
jgi:hypothetical protein